MRTTINISEQLYRDAKARASVTKQTVSEVIEDAVREALRPKPRVVAQQNALPVFGGGGVLPGVDVTSSSALWDLMDEGVGLDAMR